MNFTEKCNRIGADLLEKVLEVELAELNDRETEMTGYFAYGLILKQAEIDKPDNQEIQEAIISMLKNVFAFSEEYAQKKYHEMENIWSNQKDKNDYALIYQGMKEYKYYAEGNMKEVYDMLTNLIDFLATEREEEKWDDEDWQEEEENQETGKNSACEKKDEEEVTVKTQTDILTGYKIIPEILPSPDVIWKNMMESSKKFVEKLYKIEWFSNCGNKKAVSKCEIKYATKVETAEKYCRSARWENVTLYCIHNISSNVSDKWIGVKWNDVVQEIKDRFMPELADVVYRKWEEKYELSKTFRIEFKCILEQFILANCYKEFYHEPLFEEVLGIYEQGYFPCGWQGKFPEGKIIVF